MMKICLEVISGGKKGLVREYGREKESIVLGREMKPGSQDCDISFDHLADAVATRGMHCEVKLVGNAYVLKNAGAKNGTYVNSLLVEEQQLRNGDVIQCGLNGPQVRVAIYEDTPIRDDRPYIPVPPVRDRGMAEGGARREAADGTFVDDAHARERAPGGPRIKSDSAVIRAFESGKDFVRKSMFLRVLKQEEKKIDLRIGQERKKTRMNIYALAFVIALVALGAAFTGVREYYHYTELKTADRMLEKCVRDSESALLEKVALLERDGKTARDDIEALKRNVRSMRRSIQAMSGAVNEAGKAVVRIATTYDLVEAGTGRRGMYDGRPCRFSMRGSGFCVREDGYIITNAHVANPWAFHDDLRDRGFTGRLRAITVTFNGTGGALGARIVAVDRQADLALLKVDKSGCPSLKIESQAPAQACPVVILGFPSGLDEPGSIASCTALAGIVSRVDEGGRLLYDITTQEGNSGGPVITPEGKVIAVHRAGLYLDGGRQFINQGVETMMTLSDDGAQPELDTSGTVEIGDLGSLARKVSANPAPINTGISGSSARVFAGQHVALQY